MLKRIVKTFLSTLIILFIAFWLLVLFTNGYHTTAQQQDFACVMCLVIGIIIAIFWCTFTILDEIRKNK